MAWKLFGGNWLTGIVCWWPGAIVDIPNGWHLCDGNEGTPDYRNVLLIGAGDLYTPGQVLGSLTHLHLVTGFTGWDVTQHRHDFSSVTESPGFGVYDYESVPGDYQEYGEHSHTFDGLTDLVSPVHRHTIAVNSQAAAHLPPCKAGCWIMKL